MMSIQAYIMTMWSTVLKYIKREEVICATQPLLSAPAQAPPQKPPFAGTELNYANIMNPCTLVPLYTLSKPKTLFPLIPSWGLSFLGGACQSFTFLSSSCWIHLTILMCSISLLPSERWLSLCYSMPPGFLYGHSIGRDSMLWVFPDTYNPLDILLPA